MDEQKIERAVRTIARVYDFDMMGGNLHVLIDDENLDDECMDWGATAIAENLAEGSQDHIRAEQECLAALKDLTEKERYIAVARHYGTEPFDPDAD
jgi:hypothetical protein